MAFPVPALQAFPAALVVRDVGLPDDVVDREAEVGAALELELPEVADVVETAGVGVGGRELHAPTAARATTVADPTHTVLTIPWPMASP